MKQLPLFFLIIFTLESSAREINEVTFSYTRTNLNYISILQQ